MKTTRRFELVIGVFLAVSGFWALLTIPSALHHARQSTNLAYTCSLSAPGYGELVSAQQSLLPLGVRCQWLISGEPVEVLIANWPFSVTLVLALAACAGAVAAAIAMHNSSSPPS